MTEAILSAAPVPLVQIGSAKPPRDGLWSSRPSFCTRKFAASNKCTEFYQGLANQPAGTLLQCPFGFAALVGNTGGVSIALTAFVPFPRLGGGAERARAKDNPRSRVDTNVLRHWLAKATEAADRVEEAHQQALKGTLESLHEIRALNGRIRTITERICREHSRSNPESAPEDLVRAWKASQLVSLQMDVLDILGNPSLTLPQPDSTAVFFKLVDKIFRIYRPSANTKGVSIYLDGASHSQVKYSQKTFHIIPSVLIDNAIKYSSGGSRVEVRIVDGGGTVAIEVENIGPHCTGLEETALFHSKGRGEAAKRKAEGSGVGLYLAKKVAQQHRGTLTVNQSFESQFESRWVFRFEMPSR